jgi:glycosyltransferase involved in cell wall biosynthesis
MRILFLSTWYPYPPDNGSRIRVFNLVKRLARHHEVALLSFARGPVSKERLTEMESYCRPVHAVPYKEFSPNRLKALLGFLSSRPRSVVDTYSREMQVLVEQVRSSESFDVVVASQAGAAPYALLLSQAPRVFEEVELAVIYERFASQRSLLSRARSGLTWWKMSRFMDRLLRDFQGCTVVSEQERDLLARVVPEYGSVAVVPNGVDLEENSGDFGPPGPDTLVYSGALTYGANFDAMEFFLRDIFPLVKARRPDASLRITGRTDGVPIEQLPLGDGVELTGYLDDIRPAVAQSRACVVPLRVGGGTRLKILEADTPGEFAEMVLRLLTDDSLHHRLRDNGRRLVRECYDWSAIGARFNTFLEWVASQHRMR